MKSTVELIFNCKNIIGEGVCWDSSNNRLYWVDILGKKIMLWDVLKSTYETYDISQFVGTISLCTNGQLILALQDGLYFYDIENRNLKNITQLEETLENNRFNDGKCDPAGRFWVGTMEMQGQQPVGNLYMLDHNLTANHKQSGIRVSNGMTWSLAKDKMYYIDTPTNQLKVYYYNNLTGEIVFEKVLVEVSGKDGFLDGMTIDTKGNLWVAMYGGYCINCYDGQTGDLLQKIDLPTANITSCTFGGSDMKTLFITSATNDLTQSQLKNEPLAGALFKVETDVVGTEYFRFKV